MCDIGLVYKASVLANKYAATLSAAPYNHTNDLSFITHFHRPTAGAIPRLEMKIIKIGNLQHFVSTILIPYHSKLLQMAFLITSNLSNHNPNLKAAAIGGSAFSLEFDGLRSLPRA